MDITKLRKLLTKYLKGSSSKAENYLIDAWYESFDNDQNQSVPGIVSAKQKHETRQRIFNGIKIQEHNPVWYKSPVFRVACSVIIICTTGLLFLSKPRQAATPATVFTTSHGQTKKILLSDSSIIWLNANSRLKIPASYASINRTVNLDGEAYFEVKHNPSKPFFVKTKSLETKVLGTTFNIRAYLDSKSSKVTLFTGAVSIGITGSKRTNRAGIILKPNQTFEYDQTTRNAVTSDDPASMDHKAWITGNLIFHNMPLQDVAEMLFHSHELKITLQAEKIRQARIYAQFNTNDDPEYIIKTICKLINAKYTIQGKNIKITQSSN